jgi:hypothetical protein
MALRWLDSFDRYGTPQLPVRYASAPGAVILVAGGRRPPASALVPGAGQDVRLAVAGTAALISGCALLASAVTANTAIMRLRRSGVIQTTLGRTPAGAVFVARGDLSGPQLGISATGVLAPDTYGTVAWQIRPDPSTGQAIVVINGATVLSISGANTAPTAGYDELALCGDAAGAQRFDDWYVLDVTGDPPNALLPQDVRVDAMPPIGAGVYGTWAPSDEASTRWQCIDDAGMPNEDGDYTTTIVVGLKDSFTPPPAPSPGATVYGAQVSVRARRASTSAVPVTIAPLVRQFGAEVVGSAVPLTATYGYITAPVAPPGGVGGQAWLATLEFGYQRT